MERVEHGNAVGPQTIASPSSVPIFSLASTSNISPHVTLRMGA
jgi:hypothetical protein